MRFSLFLNHSALALSLSIATSMFSNARGPGIRVHLYRYQWGAKSVPESAPYLNPHGNFNALLIGGLDQQIRLTVTRDADNSAVYSTTTSIISVDDRISSANGNMFYGKTVTIPPISDGRYTIKSEILDSKSTVVSTTSHPL